MKRIKTLIAAAAISLAGFAGSAAPAYRTDTNPGLLYWEAFQLLPELKGEEKSVFEDFQNEEVDDVYLRAAASYGYTMTLVRRAAKLKNPCDWGIDLADGAETLLPHLAKAKAVATATRFRAKAFLHQAKENEAVEDIVGACFLARRVPQDDTLISVLVQIASESILTAAVAENFGAFSPEALKKIQDGLDACPPRTTVANSILKGERCFIPWVVDQIEGFWTKIPGDNEKAFAVFRKDLMERISTDASEDMKQHSEMWDSLWKAAGGTKEGLIAQIRSLDAKYLELQKINELPYAEYLAANAKFYTEVRKSTNAFVRVFFPALEKGRSREFYAQAYGEMLRAAIQYRLGGKAALDKVRDPFGEGPFAFRRYEYDGVDRGFELGSAIHGDKPSWIVFVEKPGIWFDPMSFAVCPKDK